MKFQFKWFGVKKDNIKKLKLIDFDKKDLSWKETFSRPIIKAFIINMVVLLVLNAIAYARFESDADIMMSLLLSGVTGAGYTSHLGFSNSLLFKIIAPLSSLVKCINWYTWLIVLSAFVAVVVLNKLFLDNHTEKNHLVLIVAFNIFIGYECYMFPSYIKSAIIGSFTVAISLKHMLDYSSGNIRKYVILAIGFLGYGFLSLRGTLYGFVGALVCVAIGLLLQEKKNIKRLLIWTGIVLISFGCLCGLRKADEALYAKESIEGKLTAEYIDDIEKLLVFGYPDYSNELGEKTGISADQYRRTFSSSNCFLVEERTIDSLSWIKEVSSERIMFKGETLLRFFRTVPIAQINVGYLYLFLVALLAFLASGYKNKRLVAYLTVGYCFVAYAIAYFNYAWDNRVTQLIVFLPVVYLLYTGMQSLKVVEHKELVAYLIVFGVVLYNRFGSQMVTTVTGGELAETVEEFYSDNNHYIAFNLNGYVRPYSPYKRFGEDLLDEKRLLVLNGYYMLFPEFNEKQYFAHSIGELWYDGETPIYIPDFYVVE